MARNTRGSGCVSQPDMHAMKKPQKPPKALDAIVDKVLAYRPKPKTKPAKKRQRVRKRIQKARL